MTSEGDSALNIYSIVSQILRALTVMILIIVIILYFTDKLPSIFSSDISAVLIGYSSAFFVGLLNFPSYYSTRLAWANFLTMLGHLLAFHVLCIQKIASEQFYFSLGLGFLHFAYCYIASLAFKVCWNLDYSKEILNNYNNKIISSYRVFNLVLLWSFRIICFLLTVWFILDPEIYLPDIDPVLLGSVFMIVQISGSLGLSICKNIDQPLVWAMQSLLNGCYMFYFLLDYSIYPKPWINLVNQIPRFFLILNGTVNIVFLKLILRQNQSEVVNPVGNATWNVNSPATITWKITGDGPKATKLTVDLIAGKSSNSQWVATICDNLDPSATFCTWNSVPSYLPTLPSGYSVRINYNVNPPDYDYSSKFQIIGLTMGSDDKLPRQPSPEACLTGCDGSNIINPNPGTNANPPYNRSNDERFQNSRGWSLPFSSFFPALFLSLLLLLI